MLAGLLLFAVATPAAAHARLISTDPAEDAVLPDRPTTARLIFDQAVQPAADGVVLYRADRPPQPIVATAIGETVEVPLPDDLGQGTFLLGWKVRSEDSHVISGVLEFSVGHRGPPPTGPQPTTADAAEPYRIVAQSLAYLGLLTAIGLALFDALVGTVRPAGPLRQYAGRTRRRLELIGVAAGVAGWIGLAVLAGLTGAPIFDPLLAVLLAGAGLALLLAVPDRETAVGRIMIVCGAVIAAASGLPVGHTRTEQPAWLMLPADLLHVLTGAIWFGGLIGLALLIRSVLGQRPADPAPAAAVLGRFSLLAGVAVVALAVTGTVQALIILPAPVALTDTGYGRVLLVKIGLTAVAVVLAAVNHFSVIPRVRSARPGTAAVRLLRRSVLNEAAIIVLAVVTAGVLVGLSPSIRTPAAPESFTTQLETSTVRGRLIPGRVGGNTVEWTIVDAEGRTVRTIGTPSLRAIHRASGMGPLVGSTQWVPFGATTRGPGGTTAQDAGSYRTSLDLPLAGTWRFEIAARISTFAEPVTEIDVEVAP